MHMFCYKQEEEEAKAVYQYDSLKEGIKRKGGFNACKFLFGKANH